jgi:hypothetical protein
MRGGSSAVDFWRELLRSPDTWDSQADAQVVPTDTARPAVIQKVEAAELSYEGFVEMMLSNQPVLIAGAAADWRSVQEWVDADGRICLDFLEQQYGTARVCVTDTARCASTG